MQKLLKLFRPKPHEHVWKIRWKNGPGLWSAECTGKRCEAKKYPPMMACMFDEGREFTTEELVAHVGGGWRVGSV